MMSTYQICDCIISGAGPTGLVLALELARRGKQVRIFDRSPGPRPEDQSRALGILPPTLTVLEPSGVTGKLVKEGLKVNEARVFYNGKHRFSLRPAMAGGKYPFLLSLPQGRTERILLAELEKQGVQVEWNSQVVGIKQDDVFPALIVEHNGEAETVQGNLVAGCDGVHSVVREELGIAFEGDRLSTVFSLADVELKHPLPKGVASVDLLDQGVLAQIPLPNGTVRLISSNREVEKQPDVSTQLESVGWTSDFSISFHHAKSLMKGRFFLAGDAAHVHSPIGGRGMNTGIGDAARLAYLICEGRESEYEQHRLPVAKQVISQTRRMTNLAISRSRFRSPIVRFLIAPLMQLNFIHKRAAQQLLAYDMPYPEWIERGRY